MLRRALGKAAPLASKAMAALPVAAVPTRTFSHHVDVPKNLTEGFPFQVLPHKIGSGEKKITIGPMTGVDYEHYPIEEDPDKNPAIAFVLTENMQPKKMRASDKRGIAFLFGAMFTYGAWELYILGGFHAVPQAVHDNYKVLDRRDAIYGSQYEKSWSELRAEDYA
jgi:hypothetical protein